MNCYEPGQLIILPSEGNPKNTLELINSQGDYQIDLGSTIDDLFLKYDLKNELHSLKEKFHSLPFIAEVDIGQEETLSIALQNNKLVTAAMPNYAIFQNVSLGPVTFNIATIDHILKNLNAEPVIPLCGSSAKVAILDTGVDPLSLKYSSALSNVQYCTDSTHTPSQGLLPQDNDGHGSAVAHIINSIAPSAEIHSIKVLDQDRTLGGLLGGIFISEAIIQPDIFNLSLSFSCDPRPCPHCNQPTMSSINAGQVQLLFSSLIMQQRNAGRYPVFIASASNGKQFISMPASFQDIIGVGGFDLSKMQVSSYSRYGKINKNEYLLAPGGSKNTGGEIGQRNNKNTRMLYGTSFSAAFVSGIAARYVCMFKGGQGCSNSMATTSTNNIRDFVTKAMNDSANRSWNSYDKNMHGMGLVSYDQNAASIVLKNI